MGFYTKLFEPIRSTTTNFLEIGIDQGGSMFVWRDYFPHASIYGIDISIPECVVHADRLHPGLADQGNSTEIDTLLSKWGNPVFDIILDDGGHYVRQQRISINALWSSLKPGGYYIIEDLHTNIKSLQNIHPHLKDGRSKWIDETPTIHEKIINIIGGSVAEFSFPTSEIGEIHYFNTPSKYSLSCAIKKSSV